MTVQIIRQYWHPKLQVDVTEFVGLSTDVKPTILTEGSTFRESDAGDDYLSGPLGWTAKPAAAAQSVALSGAIPAGTNNIGDVDVLTLPALIAGEAHIGETSGWKDLITVTPAIAAAVFSAKDVVGGKLTIAGAVRVAGGKGKITGLKLVDASKENAGLLVFIFGADLAGTYADNSAEAVTAADWLKWIGTVKIIATDYEEMANASLVDLGFEMDVKAAVGTTVYALVITTGTPTYGANALQLIFAVGEGN